MSPSHWLDQALEKSAAFIPHGHCYLWIPSLLWLHVISDFLIGIAYVGISAVLYLLVRKIRLPFSPVFIAFGLFIGLCGITHFMKIWTVWNPDYWVEGWIKAATAAASVATAIGLVYVRPQIEEVVHAARLSDAPHPDHLRISAKRETSEADKPAGRVSNWLHDNVQPGMQLKVTHPFGDFTPDTESAEPIVLLSAGVGITPMTSALNRIREVHPERHVLFAPAARGARFHAHQEDLAKARATMPNLQVVVFYEDRQQDDVPAGIFAGRMDISRLPQWPRTETHVYLCGPEAFMQTQWRSLLDKGVPASHLHREVFGPDLLTHIS